MLKYNLKENQSSLVLLGNFNPSIFNPYWLSEEGCIKKTEEKTAKINITHPQISDFSVGEWLHISVTPDRFQANLLDNSYLDIFFDLVISIFDKLLYTPLTQMGINNTYEYSFSDIDGKNKLLKLLAPSNIWQQIKNEPIFVSQRIAFKKESTDLYNNFYNVSLSQSEKNDIGLSININDHYELKNVHNSRNIIIMELFQKNWHESNKETLEIANKIMGVIDD